MDEVEQAHPHRGGVLWAEAVEEVYVHAATEDSALRSDEQAAWGCGRELVDRVGELAHQLLVEQVQRRTVDAHDRQRTVVVELDEARRVGSGRLHMRREPTRPYKPANRSATTVLSAGRVLRTA